MVAALRHNYHGNLVKSKETVGNSWPVSLGFTRQLFFRSKIKGYAETVADNSGRAASDVHFITSIQNCLCTLYFYPIIYDQSP